jgi:hypothetical protein
MAWRKIIMGKPKSEDVKKFAERLGPAIDEVLSRPIDGPILAKARQARLEKIRAKSKKMTEAEIVQLDATRRARDLRAEAAAIDKEVQDQERMIAWLERNPEAEAYFAQLVESGTMVEAKDKV